MGPHVYEHTLSCQFKPDPLFKVVGHPMIITEDRAPHDLNCSYSSVTAAAGAYLFINIHKFKADLKKAGIPL